jgi:hypothetical protein
MLLLLSRNHRDAQAMDPSARFIEWRRCQIRARLFKEHGCVNGNDIAAALHTPDILTSETLHQEYQRFCLEFLSLTN